MTVRSWLLERRAEARPRDGDLRPCAECGDVLLFQEAATLANGGGTLEPGWRCRKCRHRVPVRGAEPRSATVVSMPPPPPVEPKRGAVVVASESPSPAPSSAAERATRTSTPTTKSLLDVVARRRGTAMVTLAIGFVLALLYRANAPAVFEGRVQLLLDQETINPAGFKDLTDLRPAEDYFRTQHRLLQSRAVARIALQTLGVGDILALRRDVAESRFALPWRIGWRENDEREADQAPRDDTKMVDLFLTGLTVAPVQGTRLVSVTYHARNGAFAAGAANAIAQAFVQRYRDTRADGLRDAGTWLATRLAEQRQHMETAEMALQRYREDHNGGALADREHLVAQPLHDLNATLTTARAARIKREAVYQQVAHAASDAEALEVPAIGTTPTVEQARAALIQLQHSATVLGQRLGDLHPTMVQARASIGAAEQRLHAEIQKAIVSTRAQYEAAMAEEQGLSAAVTRQQSAAVSVNRTAIGDAALEREAITSRQIFQSLLERVRQTEIVGPERSTAIQIVDPAEVPRQPLQPDRRAEWLRAFAFSLALAGAVVFLLDAYDNRLTSRDDIRTELGLALLGSVPLERTRRRRALTLLGDAPGVSPGFAEAFATIRTNVLFSQVDPTARVLMVTSANPGEGKSVTAMNVAAALAHSGQRVLLIDADMRRPTLHDRLNRRDEPGLSHVLTQQAPRHDAITATAIAGVWLLPAGQRPPGPNELLGSRAFLNVLTLSRREFDWIVIDTPPVLAVSDAAVVAAVSDAVILVVAADRTTRRQAHGALAQLAFANAPMMGAVLNRVDVARYPYYYRDYERSAYGGYTVGDGTRLLARGTGTPAAAPTQIAHRR
jgi:capsular exopolysaccharide synthesis family protein